MDDVIVFIIWSLVNTTWLVALTTHILLKDDTYD